MIFLGGGMMEHMGHELWHEILPILGSAIALAITGYLFHRKRNK